MSTPTNAPLIPCLDLVTAKLDAIHHRYDHRETLAGYSTGLIDLDAMTAGFKPGCFNIIASSPAMGKSAFLIFLLQAFSVQKHYPSVFFSLQQQSSAMIEMLLVCVAKIDANRIRTGHLHANDFAHLNQAAAEVAAAPIHFSDNLFSLSDIAESCRQLAQTAVGLKFVFVDDADTLFFAGDADVVSENRAQFCQHMQKLARELNLCVFVSLTVERSAEKRKNKRPLLSDLPRQMEQSHIVDFVAFLYRDEYYDPETTARGEVEIIIAKHRHGPIGTVDALFQASCHRFLNRS